MRYLALAALSAALLLSGCVVVPAHGPGYDGRDRGAYRDHYRHDRDHSRAGFEHGNPDYPN